MAVSLPPRALLRVLLLLATVLLLAGGLPSRGVSADEPGTGASPEPTAPPKPEADAPEDPDDLFDAPTTFTKEQVENAILKAVKWLKNDQLDSGGWEGLKGKTGAHGYGQDASASGQFVAEPYVAGVTSLALYTLLKCGVDAADPVIKKGFAHLKSAKLDEPPSSYEIGMQLLALCATADKARSTKASEKAKPKLVGEYRGWAQKLVDQLLKKRDKFKIRGWRYNKPGSEGKPDDVPKDEIGKIEGDGQIDLSGTQIATLALFAANRVGLKVPPKVWEDILAYSMEQQEETGQPVDETDPVTGKVATYQARGFAYRRGLKSPADNNPMGGMTACGLANVMMARFVLTDGGRKQEQWDKRPDSKGKWRGSWRDGKPIPPGAKEVQDSVYDGLAWLKANWSSPFVNLKVSTPGKYNHYWHYALERAMDLVGNQRIGDHFWYSEIGQELIDRQEEDGCWSGKNSPDSNNTTPYAKPAFLDTCFSLLFLRRATKGSIPFPSVTGGSDEDPVDNR